MEEETKKTSEHPPNEPNHGIRSPDDPIDIRPIKEFVASKLPPSSLARRIILEENDIITLGSLVEKAEIWIRLIREEENGRR